MINSKFIDCWIDIALRDIEVSKLLFEKKMYSNAFYHFQQASEKGLKAYAFMAKLFTSEKDAFQTNHYTLKIFVNNAIKQQKDVQLLREYDFKVITENEGFEDYTQNLDKTITALPTKGEVFEYSSKHLIQFLKLLHDLKSYKISLPENFLEIYADILQQFIASLKKINSDYTSELESEIQNFIEDNNNLSSSFEEILIEITKEIYRVQVLYISAIVTHNHNNLSRYPQNDFNPLRYYNLKRPIIKMLPEFLGFLHTVLIDLKKMNKAALLP